jgi:NADPH:quinone reductase
MSRAAQAIALAASWSRAVRAAIVHRFGPPENITLEERPDPEPREGEVVARVLAAGVNFADLLMVAGRYQVKPPLPFVPGLEFGGIVTAVGSGVERWRPGDRVMGAPIGGGCFAEQVAVPAEQLFPAPESLPIELAAQFVVAHGTAAFAFERARLQPGETVLVSGAGGGVGTAAIAIARRLGATVIAAAGSPEKLRAARLQGAHETIEYRSVPLRETVLRLTGGKGADVVLDTVGGSFFDDALRATARRGRILVVGFASGTIPRVPAEYLLIKNIAVLGVGFGGVLLSEPAEAHRVIDELLALHAAQPFTAEVGGRFGLEEVRVALQRLAERGVVGKQLIVP